MVEAKKYLVLKSIEGLKDVNVGDTFVPKDWNISEAKAQALVDSGNIKLILPVDAPVKVSKVSKFSPSDRTTKAKYKITGVVAIVDGSGYKQGEYRVGHVYDFTQEVGDEYVKLGVAEKVLN